VRQFGLADATLAKALAEGDKVAFSFTDEGNHLIVQTIRKVP
jgi:Cu/Ag efflux protein CusF